MKRVLIATLALSMIAAVAGAQRGGRGNPAGPPRGGQEGGPRHGGGDAIVASDGTIFISRMSYDEAAKTSSTQITAVRSSGAVAWTATLTNARGLRLSGSNLLSVTEAAATDGTVSTTITAIATASGSQAWTRALSGRVTSLDPFSGGTYALVVTPAATTGGTATRSLVAIGNDGSVLWTVSLT